MSIFFGGLVAFKREDFSMVCVLSTVSFVIAVSESIPFVIYPPEAERKGATATEYGLVFGAYALVAFIACPIWGKYVEKVGAAFLIIGGLFLGGCGCILFGLLHYIGSYTDFISLSFAIISMQALGMTTAQSMNRAVIGILFPKTIATTFAFVEGFNGLGYLAGPTLAATLFEVGGYACPFIAVGAFTILSGIVLFFVLPDVENDLKTRQPIEILSLLKITPILVDMLCIAIENFGSGFYYATLEPHLRPLKLSPIVIGTMLSTIGALYVMISHLIGRFCEARVNPKMMVILGSLFGITGFLLVSSVQFVHINNALWMIYLGMVCEGLCEACIFIGAFIDGMRSAISHGLPDDISTYGIMSGSLSSSYYLGGFLGPSAAGILFDNVGFEYGTILPMVLHACIIIAMIVIICTSRPSAQKGDCSSLSDDRGCGTSMSEFTDAHALTADDCHGVPARASITDVTSTSGYESNDSETKHLLLDDSK